MTLSCTEAIQPFQPILPGRHILGQHSKLSLTWGLAIDSESYDAEFDITVIFETEFHENNCFHFPPRQAQM